MVGDKNHNGAMAEMKAISSVMELKHTVSRPISDARYDFVVDLDGDLLKVQAKCGFIVDRDVNSDSEYLRVEFRSRSHTANGELKEGRYTSDEVDVYTVYNPKSDEVYWFDFDEVGSSGLNRTVQSMRQHLIHKKI